MNYIVLDEKGIRYTEKQSTKLLKLSKGNTLDEKDIDGVKFTKGGVANMLKKGRIAPLDKNGVVVEVETPDPLNDGEYVNENPTPEDEDKEEKEVEEMERQELEEEAVNLEIGSEKQVEKMKKETLVLKINNKRLEIKNAK